MSWAAFFWILYGAGSTLFVVYLFRLGKNVASNRKELVQQEIQRMRSGYSDEAVVLAPLASGPIRSFAGDDTQRLRVQHIYQPDDDHVAVQGVREGEKCVINLPVRKDDGAARAGSESLSGKDKHR